MSKKLKYLSLFSGIGGFELGIGNKARCIGYSEIDKYACQIYNKHFNHKYYGNITTINIKKLPNFDLIVGGFPCQSFSIAGKRGGFKDTRGILFFNIAEIIKIKRPRLLFLENVKGLLSHNEGNTFATIIGTLDELGYDCQWQVVNSKNFGVPQNRERVFIIGHLRETSRPKIFPIESSNQKSNRKTDKQGCANTLTGRSAGGQNRRGNYIKQVIGGRQGERVYDPSGITQTLASQTGGKGGKTGLYIVRQPLKFLKRNQKNVDGKHSFTVDSMNTGGVRVDSKIRRLTPKECERLQGFPDDWTKDLSDIQRYKTLGNAVTVNVIKYIAEKLLK